MMNVECSCGRAVDVTGVAPGEAAPECPACGRALRVLGEGGEPARASGRVTVAEGPDRVGEQWILGGAGAIDLGASEEGNAVVLGGAGVPPRAARLTRAGEAWVVEDLSGSGVRVNDEVVASRELRAGDVLQVGPYELEYATAAPHEARAKDRTNAPAAGPRFEGPSPSQLAREQCPSCHRLLEPGAKICVDCGIDLHTGRALLTSREVDENALYARADLAVRVLSWVVPFGVYPIASEGLGSRRPFVVWVMTLVTVVVSLSFWSRNMGVPIEGRSDRDLMLWVGSSPASPATVESARASHLRPWQFLTYAFLHDGLLALAVNAAFLLVLGSRINALIGNGRMAVVYGCVVIGMGVLYALVARRGPTQAVIGAAGAVMALAGVYLVLFPIHRVHMAAWVRTGPSTGFRLAHNVFAVGGVWVVLIYLAVDAFMTLFDHPGRAAAWAHLLGLPLGIVIGLILLLARQAHAHGGDVISVLLGRRAWVLLGRPGRRTAG